MSSPRMGPLPALTLVLGGARSGKSRYAERLVEAAALSGTYCATAEPGDDEMRARIAAHQARRGPFWQTIEAPLALPEAVAAARPERPLLADCLTLWLSNLLLQPNPVRLDQHRSPSSSPSPPPAGGEGRVRGPSSLHSGAGIAPPPTPHAPPSPPFQGGRGRKIDEEFASLRAALRDAGGPVVLVANEVGLGIVPATPLGRRFRDLAGTLNQEMAALADRVVFLAAGLPLVLKGS